MKPSAIITFLLATIVGLCGCSKRLDGQVFIRTQGGETVKFSGIEVFLLSAEETKNLRIEYEKNFARLHELKRTELLTAKRMLEQAKSAEIKHKSDAAVTLQLNQKFDELQEETDERERNLARERLKVQWERERFLNLEPGSFVFQQEAITLRGSTARLAQFERIEMAILKTNRQKLEVISSQLDAQNAWTVRRKSIELSNQVRLAEIKVEDLELTYEIRYKFTDYLRTANPRFESRQVTNAEGRFSFERKQSTKYAVFALANRRLLDTYEWYAWIAEIQPGVSEILLHHGNIL